MKLGVGTNTAKAEDKYKDWPAGITVRSPYYVGLVPFLAG